jgi:hypothetical protein
MQVLGQPPEVVEEVMGVGRQIYSIAVWGEGFL